MAAMLVIWTESIRKRPRSDIGYLSSYLLKLKLFNFININVMAVPAIYNARLL